MADQVGYSFEGCGHCGEIDDLRAENERLKTILSDALKWWNDGRKTVAEWVGDARDTLGINEQKEPT